jgi:hypothetical protein
MGSKSGDGYFLQPPDFLPLGDFFAPEDFLLVVFLAVAISDSFHHR